MYHYSDHYTKYLFIYLLVCMFAGSCCIVIGAFVLSRGGQICKSTPGSGARSQFRELSPPSPNKHGKLTGSLWCINYLCFSTTTLSLLFYAWYDFETSYYGHPAACRNQSLIYLLQMIWEKVWVFKRKCFSKCVWWRVFTFITFE